jgi:hypothetical protein
MTGWSQKLVDAMEAAGTGGELVMAVRWHLRQLIRSGEPLPHDVEQTAEEIIREIDKTGW